MHFGFNSYDGFDSRIVYNSHSSPNSHDGLNFFAPKRAKKGSILQKTSLLAHSRVKIVLAILFLTFNSVDIRFAEVLIWRTYIAIKNQVHRTFRFK